MSAEGADLSGMTDAERARLRRAFELLPKVEGHGETTPVRHRDVLPEWIAEAVGHGPPSNHRGGDFLYVISLEAHLQRQQYATLGPATREEL